MARSFARRYVVWTRYGPSSLMYYTLDENKNAVKHCGSVKSHLAWIDSLPRSSDWYVRKTGLGVQIGYDRIGDNTLVSTVFLGIDHAFGACEQPVLWETMVFIDGSGSWQDRYCTYEEAKLGHERVCEKIRKEGLSWAT